MRLARGVLCIGVIAAVVGCAPAVDVGEENADVTEKNKQIVMEVVEAMNNLRYDDMDQFIAQTFHRHCQATPDVSVETLDEFIALMKMYGGAFADGRVEVFQLIAEGDFVAFVGTYKGTHTAPLGLYPATGKTIDSEMAGYHRIENGKIVETWVTWDNLAMFQQLGLDPPSMEKTETEDP